MDWRNGKFPAGSIRAAVEIEGDHWQAYRLAAKQPLADRLISIDFGDARGARVILADHKVMSDMEALRGANALPRQRAAWIEYREKCIRGERLE